MSPEAEDSESAIPRSAKRWRIHKRTIAVVICVVLLPWVLIAIPSTVVGGAGTTGLNIRHRLHGWPWVHLESTEYEITGNWVNGKFLPGQLPPGFDLVENAKNAAASFTEDESSVQLNLRLERDDANAEWLGESGYWSDLSNWPSWKSGTYLTPRYLGLALNLITVGLLAWVAVLMCEYRIGRHQRIFRFSLANLLFGTALLGVVMAWISHLYVENAEEMRVKDALQAIYERSDLELPYFQVDYEARFPLIVSQLLNHGIRPWGAVPIFRKVKSGNIGIRLDSDGDLVKVARIAKLTDQTQYLIELSAMEFSPERLRMIQAFRNARVVRLDIDFDVGDWLFEELGEDISEAEMLQKLAELQVNLDIDMSHLKNVDIDLDEKISQSVQLRQFMDLPSLETASIADLTTEGAEFILATKQRWPRVMAFDPSDDVSDEIRQKLEFEFDAFPPVGGIF